MYSPTTSEVLALTAFVLFGLAAGSDIIRAARSYHWSRGITKRWGYAVSMLGAGFHILTTLAFSVGAWIVWSEAYRSEMKFPMADRHRDSDLSSDLFMASWILALLSYAFVWLSPWAFYIIGGYSVVLYAIYLFLLNVLIIGTTVVFWVVYWEAGLVTLPLAIWILVFSFATAIIANSDLFKDLMAEEDPFSLKNKERYDAMVIRKSKAGKKALADSVAAEETHRKEEKYIL